MSTGSEVNQDGRYSRPAFNYSGQANSDERARTLLAESTRNVLEAILSYLRQNQVLSCSVARDIARTRLAVEKLASSKRKRRRKK